MTRIAASVSSPAVNPPVASRIQPTRNGPTKPPRFPTEFTSAVLASTRVDADAVATLRGLYHRARFGETPLGARDLEAARAALARIAADLATHPGRPTVAASDAAVPHDHPLHDEARP